VPPACANRPFGAVALAWLPLTVDPSRVSDPCQLLMPPASASLARADRPEAVPTLLSITVVFLRVSDPQLSIPPPAARARGQGPSGHAAPPDGTVLSGATRLPRITLSAIVTVAPPVKSAFDGISTPPPKAMTPSSPVHATDSGLDREIPPVIVTPMISTVGSTVAPKVPIVMTVPPPRMTVELAPLPRSRTLFAIVKPPAKVPG